jgi:dUTP pyrophosphatase
MKYNCDNCGKLFEITPRRLKKNTTHTCSRECAGKIASLKFSNKIETKCVICDALIYLKPSHFKAHDKHCCSRPCSAKLNSIKYSGSGNPRSLKLSTVERFFWDKAKDMQSKSTREDIDCNVDYLYLLNLYNQQGGKCYYTNMDMKIGGKKTFDTLSFDRIDSKKGYIRDNIVLCLLSINYFKSNFELSDVKTVFTQIALNEKITVPLKIKRFDPNIPLPFKKQEDDAGYDLYVSRIEEDSDIVRIYTGIGLQPYGNYFTTIYPRSSIYKLNLALCNNVAIIDKNYTGEIVLNFYKINSNYILPTKGDRIAQIIMKQQLFIEFEEVDELSETTRGSGGFGSTGR